MQIVHAISSLSAESGGPTSALLGMAAGQSQAGATVKVVATYRIAPPKLPVVEGLERVEFCWVGPASGPLASHPDLKRVLVKHASAADILHVHGVWEEIQAAALVVGGETGTPTVLTPHGMLTSWSVGQRRLKKWLYWKLRMQRLVGTASAIHFTAKGEADHSPWLWRLKPVVVPLGVDMPARLPAAASQEARTKYGIGDTAKVVLFLGRLHPVKRIDLLIHAISRLPAEYVLLLAGPSSMEYMDELQRTIDATGIRSQARLVGPVSGMDKIAVLEASDVLALVSDHENFGIVIVEALAAGTPVVISEKVCLAPEVSDNRLGLTVVQDPAAIASAIREVVEHPQRLLSDADRRAFVVHHFELHRVGERWLDVYAQVASSHAEEIR